ncbi:MAG TPA: bi-domain-containing oxidoreductase [Longimicrobiales bacterium]|nr:bi-domain-containing oxidoreductase [Longimicrobiales bacterium]
MKQVLQVLGTGEIKVVDVPAPVLRPGGVLVRNRASVISVGTDRTQIDFGRKSLVAKAKERPEQVKQVLQSMARDGVAATRARVRRKLDSHVALGYSCAGVVEAVGEGVDDIEVGMRVACAGAGYASHAERVWVPKNLVVPVPDDVAFDHAAFATMGAIALHGIRQAEPALGDVVAVVGLGLLGQLTVQMLVAAGVRVVAIDLDPQRVALARESGAVGLLRSEAVEAGVAAATGGLGVDATLICAATSSEDPIRLSGRITRDRGRVVLVGAVPMNVPRSPFYEKEIDLRFSRSYGPGRYDRSYEEQGNDYPIGYVRWTERRNLAEFLRLVAAGSVRLDPLITHASGYEDAAAAYATLRNSDGPAPLGVVLRYPEQMPPSSDRIPLHGAVADGAAAGAGATNAGSVRASAAIREPVAGSPRPDPGIGFVGAGSFAADTLLPALKQLGGRLVGVATARGVTALDAGSHFGFRYLAADAETLASDNDVDALFIATRHDEHARLAALALHAGKAVFVEKPLALDEPSLDEVIAVAQHAPPLMVGFNRRFAPATLFVRERLARLPGARVVSIRVNAGALPADSWAHDPAIGGGRLVGEGCHFIDLAMHLVGGARVTDVHAVALGGPDTAARLKDNVNVTLRFDDGSLATILYTSKGSASAGKERVEVHAAGATAIIDDFRTAEFHAAGSGSGSQRVERWKAKGGKQDKGHVEQLRRFLAAVRDGTTSPIPLQELVDSSRVTLRAAASLRAGTTMNTSASTSERRLEAVEATS